jgi:hypothetical protein
MINRPNNLAPDNFELWSGRIELGSSLSAAEVQFVVTGYVAESNITVVGYHTQEPPAFTMLRWPDGREGYSAPTPSECTIALNALAGLLGGKSVRTGIVPEDKVHVMMGRKKDGYEGGEVVPFNLLQARLPNCSVTDGYMVSARTTSEGVESYGVEDDEKVGVIIADPSYEQEIHNLCDELKQHHYAMERGPEGVTEFYETRWSPTYVPQGRRTR